MEREYIEVVPIGEVGDGEVQVSYNPTPGPHRSKFELHWDWGDSADTVYLGDRQHVVRLVEVLNELVERDGGA